MAYDVETGIDKQTIGICHEKQHLMEELTAAIREVLLIQQQQFKAVVNQDSDFARFDILLEMATSRKRQAKYAYLHHVETHGC
jgi:hypothetical protein